MWPGGEVLAEAQAGMVETGGWLGLVHQGAGGQGQAGGEDASRRVMVLALAEAPVLVEGRGSAEHLPAVLALDLRAAVRVHALVAAQVGELRVRLVADLTWGQQGRDSGVRGGGEDPALPGAGAPGVRLGAWSGARLDVCVCECVCAHVCARVHHWV